MKWTLSSSKKEERALLAARIVRKALQSGQPTLVQLMYKLNPDDFSGEQDVQKLIRFLEDSPLNRQALPDAGQKIGAYYRRLSKRPNESVPAFLVREDKVHDEMLKALQRLLREKELDFDGYNMTLPELKRFVGMEPEASLFYGDDANEADTMDQEEETEEEQSQRSSKTAAPSRDGVPFSRKSQSVGPSEEAGGHDKPQQRGKDVLELLMEKGLIPLAALDVIRGWLLLEMATPGEEDRRLIRAATRNKLGYYDIRSALLSMYEEKHHRNPFQHQRGGGKGGVFSADVDTTSWDEFEPYDPGASSSSHDQTNLYGTMEGQSWNDWDSWYDTSWYHDGWSEWSPADSPSHAEEPSSPDQANMVHHLMQEQEDAERQHMELQALTAESERTLAEARRAVTQAAKDRGWNSPPQQRQPRPTSMHPKGKGKGYGYGSNSFGPNQFGKSGKGRVFYEEDLQWMKGKPGSPKGKFKGSSHFKGSGKGKDLHFSAHYMYPIFSAEHNPAELGPNESIVDTGATASAGGRWAVQQLCTAVINARPDATMEVYTSDRPWFRFGNGRWGQALFKVVLVHRKTKFTIFSLPSPGVPVLTGMRELEQLGAILGCQNGRCIIGGKQTTLRRTPKKHLILDFLKDVFPPDHETKNPDVIVESTTPSSAVRLSAQERIHVLEHERSGNSSAEENSHFAEVHDLWMLEPSFADSALDEESYGVQELFAQQQQLVSEPTVSEFLQSSTPDEFLEISESDAIFLLSTPPEVPTSPIKTVRFDQDRHHGQPGSQGRVEGNDERGCSRADGRTGSILKPGSQRRDPCPVPQEVGQSQGQEQGLHQIRRYPNSGPRSTRPSNAEGDLAMLRGSPRGDHGQQSVWPMDRVLKVRPEVEVYSGDKRTSTNHQDEPADECHRGHCTPSNTGLECRRDDSTNSESGNRGGGQREDLHGEEASCEGKSQGAGGNASAHGGGSRRGGRWLCGDPSIAREEEEGGGRLLDDGAEAHEQHYDAAGGEACQRWLSREEAQQLKGAAQEFKIGAILASLQDFEPWVVWEICCRPQSALSDACSRMGLKACRKMLEDGYDIERDATRVRLLQDQKEEKPKRIWWSLKCTPWTSIQNLNQRNEHQIEALRKKRQKARRGVRIALATLQQMITADPEIKFYWEWPKGAYEGWRLPEMQAFEKEMAKLNVRLYWTEIHGCMFGMTAPDGECIKKEWYVMSNDYDFDYHCNVLCDHSHTHREGGMIGMGSAAVEATGYYPPEFAYMVARRWKSQKEQHHRRHLHAEVELELKMIEDELLMPMEQDDPMTEVSKKERDKAEALLHRLHKASGHPTNRALARLCKDRGMPEWMVKVALKLQCPACISTERGGQMVIPYSLGAKPSPWQFVTADVMDLAFPALRCKARFLVATCVVMKFVAVKMTWKGQVGEAGTDPGRELAEHFVDMWLAHRPRPSWILVDPQKSLASGKFVEFMQLAGIGVSVSPPEAHWQQGTIESLIRVIKQTMRLLREEHPEIDPQTIAHLATAAHNHQYAVGGYTPVQWAYGYDPNKMTNEVEPHEFNAHLPQAPFQFWQAQKLRHEAEELWKVEAAKEAWTRLKNAAPRHNREYHIGEWVCVWRTAIWRSRKGSTNPEPRFVGPGRVALIEPAVIAENRPMVIWVLMGTQVWRCAPEQLRRASSQEVTIAELLEGQKFNVPVADLLKKVTKVIDTQKEPGYDPSSHSLPARPSSGSAEPALPGTDAAQPGQEWQEDASKGLDRWRERKTKTRDPGQLVKEQAWRWKQLVSTNENRRREGLPPVMELPPYPSSDEDVSKVEHFSLDGAHDLAVAEEAYEDLMSQVEQLEQTLKAVDRRQRLHEQIEREAREGAKLMTLLMEACEKGEEICEMVIEVNDTKAFVDGGTLYMKKMMEASKEINFRNLTPEDRKLVEESMARELSEVLSSKALALVKDKIPQEEIEKRCIPMRWLLIWKPFDEPQDVSKEPQPGVLRADGLSKAKARIVLIGYKHPDLGKRDERTGKQLLPTSSPTLSRMGRNTLLQSAALDKHTLECADARSAFLQVSQKQEGQRLFTKGVPEIAAAMNVPYGTAFEIVGVIYGLTTAPREFWLDTDKKVQARGGEPHGIDKCIWIFKNKQNKVCGRVGTHVDDFLLCGDLKDPEWIAIREQLQNMYSWSPWKRGSFTFAGVKIMQLQDFSIKISQEHYCNDLRPVPIDRERERPKDDSLTPSELTQARGLLMKAQWRSVQTALQYQARIGIAASSLAKPTLAVLKEANAIMKELKKTSQEGLIFHSFPEDNLCWKDVIFVHFGDAARGNRPCGGDTGGFITAVASPKILQGIPAKMSILDYRSWKLDRPVRGSNGSEAQALYVTEDAGWKMRLMWALAHGERLMRGCADDLAASVESLLVMDSRGCYDALSNSDSPLLGMNSAKTGVELMAVQRGIREGTRCYPTWTPSDMNLSDCMTKVSNDAFRVWALYESRKTWIIRFNEEFVAARKAQRLRRQQGRAPHAMLDPTPDDELEDMWPERR